MRYIDLFERKINLDDKMSVWMNPTKTQFRYLLDQHKELRGLSDEDENLYIWSSMRYIHAEIMKYISSTPWHFYFALSKETVPPEWKNSMIKIDDVFVGSHKPYNHYTPLPKSYKKLFDFYKSEN